MEIHKKYSKYCKFDDNKDPAETETLNITYHLKKQCECLLHANVNCNFNKIDNLSAFFSTIYIIVTGIKAAF